MQKVYDAYNRLMLELELKDQSINLLRLQQAIDFASVAHAGQFRASGDPYLLHCIEVTRNLLDIWYDEDSLIAAILHDIIEDTAFTYEDIQSQFGRSVADLVYGMTKLTAISDKSKYTAQYDEIQRLFLAISQDVRVLFIKFADRLHNIKTLEFISNVEKRCRIARETINVYAVLASKIGLNEVRTQLEDLSFQQLEPLAHESISKRIEFLKRQGNDNILIAKNKIRTLLDESNIAAKICFREKTPYSIWHKIHKKTSEIDRMSDIFGFRILCDEVHVCYATLGILHRHYPALWNHFKDYISLPKSNGYQSLHTALKNLIPSNTVEVQIRTYAMDRVAEKGVAAHWAYKKSDMPLRIDLSQINKVHELLENSQDASEFLEHSRLEMYDDCVFCFSPKGKIVTLPKNATAIDFAFAIHTHLGATCSGCKINDILTPLHTVLNNGDQVEILTSDIAQISKEWLSFAITAKARSTIKKHIRQHSSNQCIEAGKKILEDLFARSDIEYNEVALIPLMKTFKKSSAEALLFAIGEGAIPIISVKEQLLLSNKTNIFARIFTKLRKKQIKQKYTIKNARPILEISGITDEMVFHRCKSCAPLPGEDIVGEVRERLGLIIHSKKCSILNGIDPLHVLPIQWNKDDKSLYNACIEITLLNRVGSLAFVLPIVASYDVNIRDIIIRDRMIDFFEIELEVEVRSVQQFRSVIDDLARLENVYRVEQGKLH